LHSIFSFWAWFAIGFCAFCGFLGQLILIPLTWPFDRNRLCTGYCLRLSGRIGAILNPMWRVKVVGARGFKRPQRAVFISNHCSQSDIFVICYLPWEMKWLFKDSLFKIPVFGWSLQFTGDISIKRGDRASAQASMKRCQAYVENGMPVMIFPEGTRSKTDEMQPFKDGAFRLAIESQAALVPLAVSGTSKALPKHDWRFGDARATVQVGQPISTEGMTLEDVATLKEAARTQIQDMRDAVSAT